MIDDEKVAMVGAQGLQQDKENNDLREGAGKSAPLKTKEVLAPSPHLRDVVAELIGALQYFLAFRCPICQGDCAESGRPDASCPIQYARAALAKAAELGRLSPTALALDTLKREGLDILPLMQQAHAAMRTCGWQLAPASETRSDDGVFEAALTDIEDRFTAALAKLEGA